MSEHNLRPDQAAPGREAEEAAPDLPLTGERLVPGAHPDHIVEAEHLARYELAATLAPGRVVLDAGCGAGYGSAILARAGAHSVAGIDADAPTVAFAQDRYGDVARFDVANLMSLPFADDAFDLVVCFEAIEHVVDHEQALDELRRVTSAAGPLAISTPNRGVYREDNPFHVHEMTTEEMRGELQKRFASVGVYRQQVHMATLVSDDDGQELEDPGEELEAKVRKLAGQRPGEELYGLALAADGELPELPNMVMLAGGVAVRQWQDTAEIWESRARQAEAERDAMIVELGHVARSRDAAVEELDELRRRLAAAGRRGQKLLHGGR